MAIKLFITGGTLDKQYNELSGDLVFTDSSLPAMLEQARSRVAISLGELMLVDSLDITEEQRVEILKACEKCEEERIVITHGTDTMVQTAEMLGKSITDKTIVLTGSMIPYAFGGSDALFNLGSAITAAQTLDNGVYIAMNGEVFDWDNVSKNKELGEFQLKQ